jgi:hypothetical protein
MAVGGALKSRLKSIPEPRPANEQPKFTGHFYFNPTPPKRADVNPAAMRPGSAFLPSLDPKTPA